MLSGYRFDWCWKSCGSVVTDEGGMGTASSGESPFRILELVRVIMSGLFVSFAMVLRRPCCRYAMLEPRQPKARRRYESEGLWRGI